MRTDDIWPLSAIVNLGKIHTEFWMTNESGGNGVLIVSRRLQQTQTHKNAHVVLLMGKTIDFWSPHAYVLRSYQ